MKAAVIEGPGRLAVRELSDPRADGPYDALVEILYAATCVGTDWHLIDATFPWPIKPMPAVLGHESIGRVVSVGPKVRHLKPGDVITRVGCPAGADGSYGICWGGLAELGVATDWRAMCEDGAAPSEYADKRVQRVLPEGFDPRHATMIITWRETLSNLQRLGVGLGSSVLIVGSGGNGIAFTAHARNLGASRVAVVGSAGRERVARDAGATDYFDYRPEDLAGRLAQALPDGVDLVLDAIGRTGQADAALKVLRDGGKLARYGMDDFAGYQIMPGRARGRFQFRPSDYDEAETHEQVMQYVARGKLRAGLWLDVDHPFDLDDVVDAYQAVRDRKMLKALIRIRG